MVRVKPHDTDENFIKAKVDIRSHRVKTEDGRVFRRNRKDLHKTLEDYNTYDNTLPDAPLIQQKQPQTTRPTTKQAPTTTTTCSNEPIVTRAGRAVHKSSHLKDYGTSSEHLLHCLLFAFDITHFHQCKKKGCNGTGVTVHCVTCTNVSPPPLESSSIKGPFHESLSVFY